MSRRTSYTTTFLDLSEQLQSVHSSLELLFLAVGSDELTAALDGDIVNCLRSHVMMIQDKARHVEETVNACLKQEQAPKPVQSSFRLVSNN